MFFGFEPQIIIILKLFLHIDVVATSENQRIIFKSLLMSYFIIKKWRRIKNVVSIVKKLTYK